MTFDEWLKQFLLKLMYDPPAVVAKPISQPENTCVPGLDSSSNPVAATFALEFSVTTPGGGWGWEVEVYKYTPGAANPLSPVTANVNLQYTTTPFGITFTIQPADHGVRTTDACADFQVFIVQTLPAQGGNPAKRRVAGILRVQVCGQCPP